MSVRSRLVAALVIVGAVAGCSDTADDTAATVSAVPTTARISTTTSTVDGSDPAGDDIELRSVEVVALGTSNVSGWGVGDGATFDPEQAYPAIYTRAVGEGLGVEARLHSYFPDPLGSEIRHFDVWLDLLESDEQMRADLRDARVVIVEIGFHTILSECGWDWSDDCLIDTMAEMPTWYDELLAGVRGVAPEEAIVLVIKQGIPGSTGGYPWVEPSWPELRSASFDIWWDGIDRAAATHNAIVVDGVTPMNGPDVDQDLFAANGYWQPDGLHFSPEGHQAVAEDLLSIAGPTILATGDG